MGHGIRRQRWQVLPKSGARICCVQINDHQFNDQDWWRESLLLWQEIPDHLRAFKKKEWDFVLVVPLSSVRDCWCGNDGMQAWRLKRNGYVVPDRCRQEGGCPEMWNTEADVSRKKELEISNLEEIEEYVVLDYGRDVHKSAFPEARSQNLLPTSCPPLRRQ